MSTPSVLAKPSIADLVDLGGKTAIVTGGSMGIGCGIVERLHEAGAAVVIADLDLDTGTAVAERLNSRRPSSALALQTDVSRNADIDALIEALHQSVAKRLGTTS